MSKSLLMLYVMFILTMGHEGLLAQDTRVLVENATTNTESNISILIKWYSQDLIYDEGVNIYRKTSTSLTWTRLNTAPILKNKGLPPSVIASDPDMEFFDEVVKTASKEELQEGIVMFNILVKSFQSNTFADHLGIYFKDSTATSGVTFEYKVNKIVKGREFLLGVSPAITASAYQPAPPPDSTEVFQRDKTVNINWLPEEDRFYGVNVYRRAENDSTLTKVNNNPLMISQVMDSAGHVGYPDPMFTEAGVEQNTTYYYQLSGLGFFEHETRLTAPVKIYFEDVTPPPAPQNPEGRADSMKVHLKWEGVDAEDLVGYKVYRSIKSDGPYEVVSTVDVGAISFHDTLSIPGPYYYFIAATDHAGNEAHSNLMFVEVQDVMPPSRPQGLTIALDTGRISLSWEMNNEPDLEGYLIYRTVDKDNKKNYVLLNAVPIAEDHFEQELPKNVKNNFFYFLVAVDTSFNRSAPSAYVFGAMPDILAPEKPFIKEVTYQDDHIIVEWMPNVDDDLAGYHIYRSDTAKNFKRMNINLLSKTNFRYTDRDNEPNKDYFYYLEALDSAGNVSLPSKERYARRVVAKDKTQHKLLALKLKHNKKRKQNRLQWEAEDELADMRGFVVYRGAEENKLRPITGLMEETIYVDKEAKDEDVPEYYYQVRAYAGSEVFYSVKIKWKQKK